MSIESGLPEATAEGEKALFAVFWSLALALPTISGLFQTVSERLYEKWSSGDDPIL
jgi:hypothetical protein